MENENLLTTQEVAKKLNVKPSTVLRYVQEGKLKPYFNDPYQIDDTKLFSNESIETFKKLNVKPGLTTGDVAELLGVHPQTITTYINRGVLKAEKKLYKNREIYFITNEEFENFSSFYKQQKSAEMKDYYFKDDNGIISMFQPYKNIHNTTEYGRVMKLEKNREGYLVTNEGRQIDLQSELMTEFLPIYIIEELPYIQKKGYVIFEFEFNENINSISYKVLDLFYKFAGVRNLKISVRDSNVYLEVKPIKIELDMAYYVEEIEFLKNHVVEGEIKYNSQSIILKSNVVPINITVPIKLKKRLKLDADKVGKTMDEFIVSIIKEKYKDK